MTYYTRMRYNPAQPRDPEGEDGGEWVDADGNDELGDVVTGDDGKPITFYHGSEDQFDELDPTEARAGLGSYVTPNREFAATFGPHVLEGQLHAKKILDLDDFGAFVNEDDIPAIAKVIGVNPLSLAKSFAALQKDHPDPFMFNLLENSDFRLEPGMAVKFQDWGEGSAEPAYVFGNGAQYKPGRKKFDPNQPRDPEGEDGGQWVAAGGGGVDGTTSVMFEVAPDPNDKDLTARWNKLGDDNKLQISRRVASEVLPLALKELGTEGSLDDQIGGYLGATNPSLALNIDPEYAVPAAELLGYALSQDSMMAVSAKSAPGMDAVGSVVVRIPDGQDSVEAMTKMYNKLYKIKGEDGTPLIGGYTMSNGRMTMLNFSGVDDDTLANLVDKQLGAKYDVWHDTTYAAFVEKKDYGNASNSQTGGGATTLWRKSADRLRDAATTALQKYLGSRHAGPAKPAKSKKADGVSALRFSIRIKGSG